MVIPSLCQCLRGENLMAGPGVKQPDDDLIENCGVGESGMW